MELLKTIKKQIKSIALVLKKVKGEFVNALLHESNIKTLKIENEMMPTVFTISLSTEVFNGIIKALL